MINSGRGRPKKIPAAEKAMVQLGLLIGADIAAEIDSKIPKEYRNRSDFMRQAIDSQLNKTKITAATNLSAFEALAQLASEWQDISDNCLKINDCSECPVSNRCESVTLDLSQITDFIKKVKALESKDDLSRLLKGFEMLQEE